MQNNPKEMKDLNLPFFSVFLNILKELKDLLVDLPFLNCSKTIPRNWKTYGHLFITKEIYIILFCNVTYTKGAVVVLWITH